MNEVDAVKTESQMDQVEILLAEHNEIYLDIWKFGINVSLRISDLLSITMQDIRELDTANPVLKVREAKTKKLRVIQMNTGAMAVVERRLSVNPKHVWLFQSKRREGESKATPKPVSRRSVARIFQEVGNRVVPRVQLSTHSMRKTRGHGLHSAGYSIESICKVLNHSNTSVTMRYIGLTQADINKSFTDLVL